MTYRTTSTQCSPQATAKWLGEPSRPAPVFWTPTSKATGAQSAPSIVQVQILQDDGLVRVPGTNQMVKPEVLEGLKKSAPQLFVSEADKAAGAKAESDNSKDQEALRESLARHSDDQAEAAHMMFVGEVP